MLTIPLIVQNHSHSLVSAIVDTGANCSCINTEFHTKYLPKIPLDKLTTKSVKQASGSSIGAMGTLDITFKVRERPFRHKFIVCSALKTEMILGLDFAQTYRIGIDWDENMAPYLRTAGKFLTKAMPLRTLNPSVMVNEIQSDTTQPKEQNKTKTISTSNKPKSMVRLLTRTQVRLPPKTLSVIPVNIRLPADKPRLQSIDVMGYENFYVEYPDVSILPTTHTKLNKNKAGYLILLAYNSGNEETILTKSCTIALGAKSVWKVKSGPTIPRKSTKKVTKLMINNLTADSSEPSHNKANVREALEKTAFVGRHNTYTKPKVDLKDVPLTKTQRLAFENLKKEYTDIFSTGPSDIGITDLSEMTIETRDDAIPYAARPYKLALQHQEFLRREIQALLDTDIIVPSISQYAAPCMVVPRKCKNPQTAQIRDLARLVINYKKLNKNLIPRECEKPNANGTLALVPQPRIEHMWSTLKNKRVFSSVDLRSSYHHIRIKPEDRHKTAFVCDFGKFEFTRASFGITTSPDFLKDLMNKLFFGFGSFCVVYMDDLLIFSDSPEEHLQHLEKIFDKFRTSKLKVKLSKSDFFKEELEFLGHKISIHGICPTDDKISAIQRIKPPRNVREVRSVVGLLGYLNFFIPAYSETIRHMTKLTRKNTPFVWDEKCQKSLDLAKCHLESAPIMVYPDKSKPFHLFTDASNFTWSAVLMQTDDSAEIETPSSYSKEREGRMDTYDKKQPPYAFFENKPLRAIVYHSGSFQGSQLAWSAFVKESAGIFKGVLRMSFYLTDSDVIIHSDHKPLQKFIYAVTANDRVNDWSFQIHAVCKSIRFEYIKGNLNILSDSLSRLRYDDLYEDPRPEKEGFEFNKPKIEIDEKLYKPVQTAYQDELSVFVLCQDLDGDVDTDVQEVHTTLQNKIKSEHLIQLQQKEFTGILKNVQKHKEKLSHLYIIDTKGVLKRIIRENDQKIEVVMVPRDLTKLIMFEVHEILAHPGQLKMYMFIRRCYFWKNLRTDVNKYVRNCPSCNKACLKEPKYVDFTTAIPRFPMANIAIDLLGPYLPTSRGNERILSCMDLLTHYLFLVPIKDKQAETIISAYTENIYSEAGGSHTILSDRGSEFTAKTFKEITKELGLRQVFTSPRTPTGNAVLERAHSFVKNKLTRVKAQVPGLEWDEILPHVRFAYNIVPSSASGESPFYLYHGRDPYLPTLQDLLGYKMRYLGDDKNGLMIDAMHVLYQETVAQLVRSRQNREDNVPVLRGDLFEVGDLVLLKDHVKETLKPQYNVTYRVIKKIGDKTVDISDQAGKIRRATFAQLKKTTPIEALISKIPINLRYGRQSRYLKSSLPESLKAAAKENPVSHSDKTSSQTQRRFPNTKAKIGCYPRSKARSKTMIRSPRVPWKHRLRPRKVTK